MQGIQTEYRASFDALPHWLRRNALSVYTVAVLCALPVATAYPSIAALSSTQFAFGNGGGQPIAVLKLRPATKPEAAKAPGGATDIGAAAGADSPTRDLIDGYELLPSGAQTNDAGTTANDAALNQRGLIEVRKPIFADGAALGSLRVSIDRNSQLYVQGEELGELLGGMGEGQATLGKLPPRGIVSFQQLREAGIDLRYDSATDRINLVGG